MSKIIVDTANLTRDEWLEYRRKGIGGSDAAIVCGLSPWNTRRGLYYEKIGQKPLNPNEDNAIAKEVGQRLEPYVAELFQKATGYTVYKDTNMYRHVSYPFMIVNLDYMVILPDGKKAILECKTGSIHNLDKWKDGNIPENYVTQCRHEMAVMDIDVIFIARLLGNNDFAYIRIDRDKALEAELLIAEAKFWESVENLTPPSLEDENPDRALETLARYIKANNLGPAVALKPVYSHTLSQIKWMKEQKAWHEKEAKKLDAEIKALYVPIVDDLGSSVKGECVDSCGKKYIVSYKPTGKTNVDSKKLKLEKPDVYNEYKKVSANRGFSIEIGA